MLDIYIFEPDNDHLTNLCDICTRYTIVHNTDSELYPYSCHPAEYINMNHTDEVAVYMVKGCREISEISDSIKSANSENYSILIAEDMNDIMSSISSAFRPSGIIMKPAEYEASEKILDDVYSDFCKNKAHESQFRFKIRSREYSIGISSILYFEASNKKTILRTAGQAFEFYMPMSEVIEKLPDSFVRTHKSYVVNTDKISFVDYKDMAIKLKDGSVVYLSRNYKEALQTALAKRGGQT